MREAFNARYSLFKKKTNTINVFFNIYILYILPDKFIAYE